MRSYPFTQQANTNAFQIIYNFGIILYVLNTFQLNGAYFQSAFLLYIPCTIKTINLSICFYISLDINNIL